ncbi:MAG: GrpB family protein [Streptosporangiaceae bacterium]
MDVQIENSSARSLDARLAAAQVDPAAEPQVAWRRLREAEGQRTTIIDLYELAARRRGLAGHQLPQAERAELVRSVMPVIWPGFERTAGSERQDRHLVVAAYDPSWPAQYERWRDRLDDRLAGTALRIAHVGSTAVLGLPAKPTIDIQVSVADLDDESRYVAQIEQAGVQLRSRDVLHRFFRPFAGRPRDVHVHVCQAGAAWEREHLLFRDYLRSHPDARDAYAWAKREAARVWSDDRIAYTEAKTGIILDLLDAAETWARAESWTVPPPRR